MEKIQPSWKQCVTCEFWAGSRRPAQWRDFVEFERTAKGECCGGGRDRLKTEAMGTCNSWRKWSILK